MIIFPGIYPLLETVRLVPHWGRYHHLLRENNDLTSPVGRELITDMIHILVKLSCVMFLLNESVTRSREGVYGMSALVS